MRMPKRRSWKKGHTARMPPSESLSKARVVESSPCSSARGLTDASSPMGATIVNFLVSGPATAAAKLVGSRLGGSARWLSAQDGLEGGGSFPFIEFSEKTSVAKTDCGEDIISSCPMSPHCRNSKWIER